METWGNQQSAVQTEGKPHRLAETSAYVRFFAPAISRKMHVSCPFLPFCKVLLMGDGRTEVVLLWETRAMSEQNLLVSAGSAPAGSAPAPNSYDPFLYMF
jgi:hypothetical protein